MASSWINCAEIPNDRFLCENIRLKLVWGRKWENGKQVMEEEEEEEVEVLIKVVSSLCRAVLPTLHTA
jgi:hypothetical protein